MEYRRLGKSGLKVSALSFGSWVTFGNQVDIDAALEMMTAAYDAGVNFKATGDCLIIAPAFVCEKKHIDEIFEKLRTGIKNYMKK